jgi:hypothetical protein
MNTDTARAQSTIFRVRVEPYSARHIAKTIGCSLPTAYDWRSGRRSPSEWIQDQIIANLTNHAKTLELERELTAARDEIAEWQILNGWGETPEIINNFIEEQQTRIHLLAQNLEEELDRVTEQRDGLRSGIDYASDQLHKVTEQRDRLAVALWNMLNQEHGSAIKAGILLRSLNLQHLNPNVNVLAPAGEKTPTKQENE